MIIKKKFSPFHAHAESLRLEINTWIAEKMAV